MCAPENIVHQDKQIGLIIGSKSINTASDLFDRYRIAGSNKDAFVAALIGRLCVLEAQASLKRGGEE